MEKNSQTKKVQKKNSLVGNKENPEAIILLLEKLWAQARIIPPKELIKRKDEKVVNCKEERKNKSNCLEIEGIKQILETDENGVIYFSDANTTMKNETLDNKPSKKKKRRKKRKPEYTKNDEIEYNEIEYNAIEYNEPPRENNKAPSLIFNKQGLKKETLKILTQKERIENPNEVKTADENEKILIKLGLIEPLKEKDVEQPKINTDDLVSFSGTEIMKNIKDDKLPKEKREKKRKRECIQNDETEENKRKRRKKTQDHNLNDSNFKQTLFSFKLKSPL